MRDMTLCQVCGNEIEWGSSVCRYCGNRQEGESPPAKPPFLRKIINLKQGHPPLETALRRLTVEIDIARREGVQVLILIHGYGSSGKGGVIREECRKALEYMRSRKEIDDFIPGEGGGKSGPAKALFRRYPQLSYEKNFKIPNPGLTIVVL